MGAIRLMSTLRGLIEVVDQDPRIAEIVSRARATGASATQGLEISAPSAVAPFIAAAISQGTDRVQLIVTATAREAEDVAAALESLIPEIEVAEFPAWETLPHERLSPSSDTVGRRLGVLRRLVHPEDSGGAIKVVVAPIRAVLQPIVKGLGDLQPVAVSIGDEIPMEELIAALAGAAYARTDLVDKRGQFAVRGGIVDVFPPTEEHPVRLEFWGDTVEEIRYFKVADQRSLEIAQEGLWAPPCRELLLTDEVRARARALANDHPELMEILDKLADGTAVEGMEALSPVLADGMELLVDLMPAGSLVMVCDPERVRTRAHDLVATSAEFLEASWHNAAAGNVTPIDLGAAAYQAIGDVRSAAVERDLGWWTISPFGAELSDEGDEFAPVDVDVVQLNVDLADNYRGETERACADIAQLISAAWSVVVVTAGHGTADRLAETFRGEGIAVRVVDEIDSAPEPSMVTIVTGNLDKGFALSSAMLSILTETDLVGQKATTRDARRLPARRRQTIDPLQLKSGDFVVHEQHGVGRYVEMVQRTVANATREYLLIEYAPAKRGQPGDRLYVPTDQLDQVTRYVGGESPSLHRLGGADWASTKARARKAVRQIAGELIRLYAARMASRGYQFSPDTVWQRELEDAFPYNETPDQQSAIDEVKGDMENQIPMDRLICGDVGYGKTEIAVRAAFKAVQDGKQVAILVPTTLLVQQHFSTFSERYAAFPVKLAALSRFQTDKQAREVIAGIADGTIDVVIGTHRLFSSDIRFKDLGLVIVDEEQRFGVEHKEHLKALRTNVDFLTMSATPIPRTLEMAVTGIREMSTIQTPPEERHPVLTYVGPYDEKQVAATIRRELLRDGQVFFVHNRVDSIERVASKLRDLVPEARVQTAHGQMNEHALEQVIVDFWEKEFDVLVSTTIVESGLDIPNANTLILDRADTFGLSQLHQLRGRVGRSRERGYAYFLYPPEKPLSENAYDRLATIAANTDLGSGMAVAMKDLEIRGAGNLLGGEQSGHIADVGFDLYIRLVGEAVAEYRQDKPVEEVADVRVELPIDAHMPHDYVAEERLRLEAYKRLASASTSADLDAVAEELLDRYGQYPEAVANLLSVARFRIHARRAGLSEVVAQGNMIRFAPVELPDSRAMRLTRIYPGSIIKPATRTILVPRPMTARVGGQPVRDTELLEWLETLVSTVLLEPVTAS
jgi:transcription-repair coupling factor (superfamily II helicase)